MTPMNLQNKINANKDLTYTANPKMLFDKIEDIETQFSDTLVLMSALEEREQSL
jgi:hypothetical protein